MERRLAAIMVGDLVGYSRLMATNEEETLARVKNRHETVLMPEIVRHHGRLIKTTGDGFLVEFASAVDAIRCAIAVQDGMEASDVAEPEERQMRFRIGVNLGDVIVDGDDLFGDGVNIAARLEPLAEPGGICVSAGVREQVRGKVPEAFADLGHRRLKNIDHTVHVYSVQRGGTRQDALNRGMFDFQELSADEIITGGCLCGAVRYELNRAPIDTGCCHCRICQQFTGSAFSVWTAFPAEALRFSRGTPRFFQTTRIAERGFCGDCGSGLTYRLMKPQPAGYIVVFTGSLDDPAAYAPTCHGGMESVLPWVDLHDELPRTQTPDSRALWRAWESVGVTDPKDWKPG